ncbi:MAG: ATP-binding protein [Hyphomicrobiaceae bacterium]|nr:MAG: ATP-binding protein [Hyphomicrobiaceae bacterium]
MSGFKKAVRQQAKLRLALSGPSGAGKTYGALKIAKGLGGRIAVIDTERGAASLYSHLVDFDTMELNAPFEPERFIDAIHQAEKAKYDILIIDSITHEWNGSGGCLEINDTIAKVSYKGNTWAAWNDTTPRHRAFLDAILQSPLHIIATMRAKTETAQEGRNVVKLGMKDEQRDGTEYEFTIVLNLTHETHHAKAGKDRSELFKQPHIISEDTGKRLLAWLNDGAPMPPEPAAPPSVNPPSVKPDHVLFGQMMKFMENSRDMAELEPHYKAFWTSREKFTAEQIAEGNALKDRLKAKFAAEAAAKVSEPK